ncbi:MAG: type II secretion system protein [Candidatus Moranbacteria bacterium]|nr:type II secretion system protein [Candidatus Moranbacteria bacterium]
MIGNSKPQINKKNYYGKGLTLVGVLVGITILSIALAAEIRLLGDTMRRETELRNIIIATNLAREGVEIAFAWRANMGWDELKENYKSSVLCADIANLEKDGIMAGSDCESDNKLQYGVYKKGGNETQAYLYEGEDLPPYLDDYTFPAYWRVIKVENCTDGSSDEDCLKLYSKVWWDAGQKDDKYVELDKNIYNWYVP